MRPLVAPLFLLTCAVLLASAPAQGQQKYVSRFDLFAGYTFLDSPKVSLFENGFHVQAGVRPKTWYSLGIDYSVSSGDMTLSPTLLTPALQQAIGTILPPGATFTVPAHSLTQTLAGGPQLACRHWSKMTLFVRPSVGAIHERATAQPNTNNPLQVGAVDFLEQMGLVSPAGQKMDWTLFYGFGGGVDFLFSKHIALRVQADLVYDHLFNDLLQSGRFTTRFSIGPCFNFGKNIAK
jgi:hypothetical protein